MTLAVYCARAWRISTFLATKVWPLTSPPLMAETIDLYDLRADIVYLRLHGLKGQSYLYGDPRYPTALSAEQVINSGNVFTGSVIYLEGCYGKIMADAFLEAGAKAIVGDKDVSWGKRWSLGPSSKIGKYWLKNYRDGWSVTMALNIALQKVKHLPAELISGMFVVGEIGETI